MIQDLCPVGKNQLQTHFFFFTQNQKRQGKIENHCLKKSMTFEKAEKILLVNKEKKLTKINLEYVP